MTENQVNKPLLRERDFVFDLDREEGTSDFCYSASVEENSLGYRDGNFTISYGGDSIYLSAYQQEESVGVKKSESSIAARKLAAALVRWADACDAQRPE